MRTFNECRNVLLLRNDGLSQSSISKQLDIPRRTVSDICKRYAAVPQLVEGSGSNPVQCEFESLQRHQYAYTLGLYLGDGTISKHPRAFRLRITLDKKYPFVIQRAVIALNAILPNNKTSVHPRKSGCVDVSVYSKQLPAIFPQHGAGRKHARRIALEAWQTSIINEFPHLFLRGLIESDGSRDNNIVNGKSYPRYLFTNKSEDIIHLFLETCGKLGLTPTLITKNCRKVFAVSIATRKDVKFIDKNVGCKTDNTSKVFRIN